MSERDERDECRRLIALKDAAIGLDGIERGKWTPEANHEYIGLAMRLAHGDTFWKAVGLLAEDIKRQLRNQQSLVVAALTAKEGE